MRFALLHKRFRRITSLFLIFLLLLGPSTTGVGWAQQIVVDGQTQTTLAVDGNVTDVTTSTIAGSSGVNSFSKFNVEQDNVVNLHLPTGTSSIVNVVHDSQTRIDGLLNAIKGDAIGGHVYFLNPFGVVVGESGVVNVGAMTMLTPTDNYMKGFFLSPGEVHTDSLTKLYSGQVPISASGSITVKGTINAVTDIGLGARNITNEGLITSGAVFVAEQADFSDVVNVAGIEGATQVSVENGIIRIGAGETFTNSGEIIADGALNLDAGDIVITAGEAVYLNEGSVLSAIGHGDDSADGDVTIKVEQVDAPQIVDANANTAITLDGATIRAGDISLRATSEADHSWSVLNENDLFQTTVSTLGSRFTGVNINVVRARAVSEIVLGGGARLEASGTVNLLADSKAASELFSLAGNQVASLGFTYGKTTSRAAVDIQEDVSISTSNLNVLATNTADLDIAVFAATEGPTVDSAVAVTFADVSSRATIADGATINVTGDLSLRARNENTFSTNASVMAIGEGRVGIAAAIFDADTSAVATLGTNLTGVQNVTISADDLTLENATKSSSTVGSNMIVRKVTEGVTGAVDFVSEKMGRTLDSRSGATEQPKLAGAVTVVTSAQEAIANIGAGAIVDADDSVAVTAEVRDARLQNHASTSVESGASEPGNPDATIALSAAVGYGTYTHNALASIGEGATIAANQFDLRSDVVIPYEVTWHKWEGVSFILDKINGNLGLANGFLTGFANSTGAANDLAIVGSVSLLDFNNSSRALVDKGASVTLRPGISTGSANILANTDISAVFGVGNVNLTLKGIGGEPGGVALGGAYGQVSYTNVTQASIAAGASVKAETRPDLVDVSVVALSREQLFMVAPSAGRGASYGISGNVALGQIDNVTEASVDYRAIVDAGHLQLRAEDDVLSYVIAGNFNMADTVSVGAGIAFQDVATRTRAFIGDNTAGGGDAFGPGSIDVSELSLDARTDGVIETISVAGSVAQSSNAPGGSTGGAAQRLSDGLSKAEGATGHGGAPQSTPGFGLGISGSASVNRVSMQTAATIDRSVVNLAPTGAGRFSVVAVNDTHIGAFSGSMALVRANASTSNFSVAMAGALAMNDIDSTIDATVTDSTVTGVRDAAVYALAGGEQLAIALGAAVNASNQSSQNASIAGSVSINTASNRLRASLDDATILGQSDHPGDINVTAYNRLLLGTGGGSLVLGGQGGVGAAITYSDIGNTTEAVVRGSTLSGLENISVQGLTASQIGAGAGVASVVSADSGSSLAGAFVISDIDNETVALVEGSIIDVIGDVLVDARDVRRVSVLDALLDLKGCTVNCDERDAIFDFSGDEVREDGGGSTGGSSIVSVAGVVQAGKNNVGISFTMNTIGNTFRSSVHESAVTAGRSVDVQAVSNAEISGWAVGVGLAEGFGGAGSVTMNTIRNDVTTELATTGDHVITAGSMNAYALDQSHILSVAGQITIGKNAAIGGAVAINDISNDVVSRISGYELDVNGSSSIAASQDATIDTFAVSGAGGENALVGSVAVSEIGNRTVAELIHVHSTNEQNEVFVTADDEGRINTLSGGAAFAGANGVGAAVSVNRIGNLTRARVHGTGSGNQLDIRDLLVRAQSLAQIESMAVGLGVGGQTGVAGSAATNFIDSSTESFIDGGANILAQANVGVIAESHDVITNAAGAAGIGLEAAGVSGSVAINQIGGHTSAYIEGDETSVSALALESDRSVRVAEGSLTDDIELAKFTDMEAFDPTSDWRPVVPTLQRTEDVRGVAVNASATHSVVYMTANVAGGAGGGIGGTTAVNIVDGSTAAFVDRALINTAAGASAAQRLDVRASDHAYSHGFVGSLGIGGAVGIGLAANTNVFTRDIQASITNSDDVRASGGVIVDARATQGVSAIAVGAAGGAAAAVGTSNVAIFEGATVARVQGSNVTAGGLAINAHQENRLFFATPAAAIGGAAFAGTASVASMTGVTQAILEDADVQSGGNISVGSTSLSEVDAWSIGAAAGAATGVAGNAVVNIIDRTTQSHVSSVTVGGQSARAQSLAVTASDDVDIRNRAGAIGLSLSGLGVGAAAAVTSISNDTSAMISDSQVFVQEDVVVDAHAFRDVGTFAASAGVGAAAGIGGVAAVTLLGEHLTGELTSELDADGDGTLTAAESQTNDDRLNASGEGSNVEIGYAISEDELASINDAGRTSIRANLDSAAPQGTSAAIGANTVIDANRDVNVQARELVSLGTTAGAAAGSAGMSVGGSVGVTRATLNVSATIHGDAEVIAGRDVDVSANAGALGAGRSAIEIDSFQGSAGVVTLGAAVADARLTSHVSAVVGAGAHIRTSQGNISVSAMDDSDVRARAEGYVAGLAAAGIVVADAVRTGATEARIGTIGTSSPSTSIHAIQGNIVVTSLRQGTSDAFGRAGAGGVVSGGAVDVNAREEGASRAIIGDDVALTAEQSGHVGGGILVDADSFTDATATARGYGGALFASVGFSSATATVRPTVEAIIGRGGQINADTLTVGAFADSRDNRTMAYSDTEAVGVGAIGFAGAGTTSRAVTDVNVTATVGSGLNIGGSAAVSSGYVASQEAFASGVVAGLAAAGGTFATTNHQSDTVATLADTVTGTVGGDLAVHSVGRSNSYARSTSGSGGIISGAAAGADTSNVTSTRTELGSPSLIRAGSMTIGASHTTDFNSRVSSVNAAIAGRSGARAHHDVDSTVDVLFRAGSELSTDSLTVAAYNESRKSELDGGAFNAQSGSGGIVNASAVSSRSNISHDTNVLIGNDSNLMITGDWDNPAQASLSAINDIFVRDKTKLDAGGAIEIAEAASHANIEQARAVVTIGNDVEMDVAGTLSIGAQTGADIRTSANAKTYGGAGAAAGHSTALINTENAISIGRAADIRTDGDIVFQAGRDLEGRLNNSSAVARTDLYNKTVIPIKTSPRADASVTHNNWINIADGSRVRSVADISLLAERGTVNADGRGTGKDLYREILNQLFGGFGKLIGAGNLSLSLSGGSSSTSGLTHVNVDGLVHAGIQNQQRLIFDTYGNVIEQSPDGITFEIVDENIATNLHRRLENLRALRIAYFADPIASAAYDAEINLILSELRELGYTLIFEDEETGELEETDIVIDDLDVRYIVIDDVMARGGDVTVTADHLGGTGSLRAPYDTEIRVENPSDMFLRLNRMLIEDRGGHLWFNGVAVSDAADINALNVGNRQDAAVAVEAAGSSDVTPSINISVTGNPNLMGGTGPIPDIDIVGDIVNLARGGTIDINNQYGSIQLLGQEDGSAPGVSAEVINLHAGRSIVQGYRDGFVYIGADPKTQWLDDTEDSDIIREGTGSYIAGNSVFLSARYLLINGLIQSGIPDWEISLPASLQVRVNQIMNEWRRAGSPAITTAADLQRYVLHRNSAVGNFTAYFNPETQQIILDEVKVAGGQVELFGEILNTGGGRIHAMDGFGQVSVNNALDYDLVVGTVDTGNIAGVIRITDTARPINGMMRTDEYRYINGNVEHTEVVDGVEYPRSSIEGRTASYQPLNGLRYEWVTGRDFTEVYEGYSSSTSWFDFIPAGKDNYDRWTRKAENDEDVLPNGEYTRTDSGGSPLFQHRLVTYVTEEPVRVYRATDSTCKSFNFWGWCVGPRLREVWDTWHGGTLEVRTRSLKADHPIAIEFIGYDAGDARALIDITSTGDVLLTNQVQNLGGNINISTDGSIRQMSDIATVRSAENIDLFAGGAIGSQNHAVQVHTVDGGSLSATTSIGNINVANRSGGLTLAALQAGGNISIEAFGNIVQTGPAETSVVRGEEISLVSHTGGIGSASRAINVEVGSSQGAGLRSAAVHDISIRQAEGDLRLYRVESRAGDVRLEVADGAMIDVNTDAVRDERTIAELQRLWDEMLLMGEGAEESAENTIAAYANLRQAEFQQYWTLRGVRPVVDEHGVITGYTADPYDTNHGNDEFERLHDLYGAIDYSPTWEYQVTQAEREALTEGVEWTEEQLTMSLGQGILFKETGSTETEIRSPNVVGHHVTLISHQGSIGIDGGEIVIDTGDPNFTELDEDARIALAAAEPDDVGVDGDVITVLLRDAINVQTHEGGELVVEARDHAYIGSRSSLYVNTVEAGQSLRIRGTDGLYSVESTGQAHVTGGRIILEGGQGGIGTIDNPLIVHPTSDEGLTSRAEGDIFIRSDQTNLWIAEIFSRGLVDLHASGSIIDVRHNRPIAIQGQGLNLYAGGDIGTEDNPLLFTMAPDGRLDSSGSNITMQTAGTMTLGALSAREIQGTIRLTADSNILMLDRIETGHGFVYLTSGGTLVQIGEGHIVNTGMLSTESFGEQDLRGENSVRHFAATNEGEGDIRLVNDLSTLSLSNIIQREGGDVFITNSGMLDQAGGSAVTGAGLLSTVSTGGQDLQNANMVTAFAANNARGGNIVFTNSGTSLKLLDVVQGVPASGTWGNITITNSGGLILSGEIRTSGSWAIELHADSGTISQHEQSRIVTERNLTTTSVGGQDLRGSNFITRWSSTNTDGGEIYLNNDVTRLEVGIRQSNGGDIVIRNTGDILANDGNIRTDNNITLESDEGRIDGFFQVQNAALLVTKAAGPINLSTSGVSAFTATVTGKNDQQGNINISNLGGRRLELRDIVNASGGNIVISNIAGLTMTGNVSTTGHVTLIAELNTIVQEGAGKVTDAASLTTISQYGQKLQGDNSIAMLIAENGGNGAIHLVNDHENLNVGEVRQVPVGSLPGDGNIVITNTGALTIVDDVRTQGEVEFTAGGAITQVAAESGIDARLLTTSSVGGTILTGANTIASVSVTNVGGGDIDVNNLDSLTVLGITQTDDGDISIDNVGNLDLTGVIQTPGAVFMIVDGQIVQSGVGRILDASLLQTSSVGGQTLTGDNTVASLLATNIDGGDIDFNNLAALAVLGIAQTDEGNIVLVNVGDMLVDGAVQTVDGDISIDNVGDVDLAGVIQTPGAVFMTVDGRIVQSGVGRILDASLLQTDSVGGQTLTGDNTVASLLATNIDGGDIDFNNLAELKVLGIAQTDEGNIVLVNVGDMLVDGAVQTVEGDISLDTVGDFEMSSVIQTPGAVHMTVDGQIVQSGAGRILDASLLLTASVGGQTLLGDNTVATFAATNDNGGDIRLNNERDGLKLTDVRQTTAGNVFVDNAGDIRVQKVAATQGTVKLSAIGSIVNGNVDTAALAESSIDAIDLMLLATGGIGTPEHSLYVDSSNAQDGVVRVYATDGIYLWETNGDMRVDEIESAQGDIGLVADGSIVNRGTAEAILRGATISARALNGGIGEADRRLTVTGTEAFNAIARDDLFIGVPVGDLVSEHLESENGRIHLFVEDGAMIINTLLSPVGVDLQASRLDIANLVHTGTAPLRLNVSGLNGLADSVNISGRSTAGVVFNYLGAEEAIIDIQTDALMFHNARIGSRGEFRNNGGFVVAENNVMELFDADLQIYPRDYPFYLVMGANRSILTDALIVNYNDDYIINHFHTENSTVRSAEKWPQIVTEWNDMPYAMGMPVPSMWWLDPVDESTDEQDETDEDGDTNVVASQVLENIVSLRLQPQPLLSLEREG